MNNFSFIRIRSASRDNLKMPIPAFWSRGRRVKCQLRGKSTPAANAPKVRAIGLGRRWPGAKAPLGFQHWHLEIASNGRAKCKCRRFFFWLIIIFLLFIYYKLYIIIKLLYILFDIFCSELSSICFVSTSNLRRKPSLQSARRKRAQTAAWKEAGKANEKDSKTVGKGETASRPA